MSRITHFAGVAEEFSPGFVHVVMYETPADCVEVWRVPEHRFRVQPQPGDIVRARICPRRVRFTVFDRRGNRRT